MASIVVLGAGRVGSAMALDLAGDGAHRVLATDADPGTLESLRARAAKEGASLRTEPTDLSDPVALVEAVDGHDLAIGSVPGPMGYETVRRVIEAGVDIVDISFFEEDALTLDGAAGEAGRVAIVDAGVAPGLSNLLLGDLEHRLDRVDRFECLVGGIPAEPTPPWRYKAPFSPIDVLAEYTRPARLRRGGETVTLPALSELERIEVPGVGTLEAFNTDGLRTLLATSRTPELVEKTMRWPGHADTMRLLRDTGFLAESPVDTPDGPVSPLGLTSRLLFAAWRYEPGEEDLTVMRVVVDGRDGDGAVRHTLWLIDRHDPVTDVSSMARTTGYTATALARFVLAGRYRSPGVTPPELLGGTDALEWVLDHLAERGVSIEREVQRIDP
jgi:saccharopine dehydrogenase-like NADP-dependent oxidoreductase